MNKDKNILKKGRQVDAVSGVEWVTVMCVCVCVYLNSMIYHCMWKTILNEDKLSVYISIQQVYFMIICSLSY